MVSDTSHPTLAPTQGNVDSENGNLPNNDNDELQDEESPGESPGENPDEEQGNTDEEKDKEKSNSEGLTIGLSVSLAVVSILFAASCYLYSKGVVWKYTKEGSNTTSVEFSLGKGSNNSSKDVKIEEVMVQYESDDDYERGEA